MLNSSKEINAMNPNFAQKFGFYIQKINIGAEKMNGCILKTSNIVITNFQIENKISKH